MPADTGPVPLKIVVAGGFGVGKTTLVRALSEIPPLLTEKATTAASVGVDDITTLPGKHTAPDMLNSYADSLDVEKPANRYTKRATH